MDLLRELVRFGGAQEVLVDPARGDARALSNIVARYAEQRDCTIYLHALLAARADAGSINCFGASEPDTSCSAVVFKAQDALLRRSFKGSGFGQNG
jgi:hypothetical protein